MDKKILKLVLTYEWYDIMFAGLKPIEVRKPTDYIRKRLFDKDGNKKDYDLVRFYRGYTKVWFEGEFEYFHEVDAAEVRYYGDVKLKIEKGDFIIRYKYLENNI